MSSQALQKQVRKLAVALREIARLEKEIVASSWVPGAARNSEEAARFDNALELIELQVDLAYVYLRRLADRLGHSVRYVLFDRVGNAPDELAKLAKMTEDEAALRRLSPICDEETLRAAFANQLGWLEELRASGRSDRPDGLRTVMEHRQSSMFTSVTLGSAGRAHIMLFHPGAGGPDRRDLLDALPGLLVGFCALATELQRATGWGDGYDRRDLLILAGEDDDVVRFWPQI